MKSVETKGKFIWAFGSQAHHIVIMKQKHFQ